MISKIGIVRIRSPYLALVLLVVLTACGPKPVNTVPPTPYDKPAKVLAGAIESTNSIEAIVRSHHNSKRAAIKADTSLSNAQRKAKLTAETNSFDSFNKIYKRALSTEREAADTIQALAKGNGSPQTAVDKVQIVANIIVNELLTTISDPETRQALTELNTVLTQLIRQLKGGS